ncbi:MAG: sulfotransferase family 2 domain-containing protein [Bacteroidota bacterium]
MLPGCCLVLVLQHLVAISQIKNTIMIINHDKQFVIFLPWKTAGSTMFKRLEAFNQSNYSRFYYFNEHLNRIVHQHVTLSDFMGLPESKLPYKKISFVRNPYDRVYSGFLQIQKDLHEQPQMYFPQTWIKHHVLKQLETNHRRLVQAQYDFDNWVALLEPEDVYQIGGNSSLPLYPSHYWTHYMGEPYVDFIGKVENFEKDFQHVLDLLQIHDSYTLDNDNVNFLPGGSDVAEYKYAGQMSESSIERINELFGKDFELFGYRKIGENY